MTERLTSQEIDDRAAEWAARIDAGELPPDLKAALEAWLAEDPRHLGAFAKARAVSLHTERARALGPNFDPIKFGGKEEYRPNRRRLVLMGGIAASLAGLAAVTGFSTRFAGFFDEQTYSTLVGETKVVPLEDGSVVTLNTNSKVTVRYTKKRRDIVLSQGEALFDVAKNRRRPFVVAAGGTQVRAVGTSFTVALLPDQPVQVLVREGVVEIKRPNVPTAPPVRVAINTRAVAPADAPIVAKAVAVAEVNRELAWRVGRIAFEGETLREAAAEFARYSDTPIVIDDPNVANLTITGLFVSNDPVGFSKAVAVSLNLRADVGQNEIHLTRN